MVNDLSRYNFPEDLKKMSLKDMELLAVMIREFLLDNISKTGGHLASNLGVVELTIAMHKIFNSPEDKFIWDVGHQSYVHKILTGRASEFENLRKLNGMSGFPKKKESIHDIYETGHSSTSISAAAGIAAARDIKGEDYDVVAVIGDGSMTGGMSFEALNNLGHSKSKAIVILNDNGMSISKNIGGLSEHLGKLRTSDRYLSAKNNIRIAVEHIPVIGPGLRNALGDAKDKLKYTLINGGIIFEELGFTYLGPVDGHNLMAVMQSLDLAKHAEGPVLVHVITQKGKGYRQAENSPNKFHGIGPFDKETGIPLGKSGESYSKVFGNTVLELARGHNNVAAISAAMCEATGLLPFSNEFENRFFDVGIAEGHAVTFAAGLATNGMKPYVAIYSSFLQRAYDQIIEDVCLQNLDVTFGIDRAGIVGADGETHHGVFDISYLMPMPNMKLFAPCDGKQLEEILKYTYELKGPCAVRYPRGECPEKPLVERHFEGKNIRLHDGKDVDILAVGNMLPTALEAKKILEREGISAGVVNICVLKPEEYDFINDRSKLMLTIEDNMLTGGFGQTFKATSGCRYVECMGWPDTFIEHGNCDALYERYGLDANGIRERIWKHFERKA